MVKIKRDPNVKRDIELSIGETVHHNTFYLPRYNYRSKLYRDYTTYEGFGYGLADKTLTKKIYFVINKMIKRKRV